MKLHKKILKSNFTISLAAFLIAQYIRFVYITTKWQKRGVEKLEINTPYIIVMWHERLMMGAVFAPKSMPNKSVISHHSDGEIIAKINKFLGIDSIRGSTSKGGAMAIRDIIKTIRAGQSITITPDGPRGPARKVNGKVIELAKKLDIPIFPVSFSSNKNKRANSWDKFFIFKPFGKGVVIVGNPISPSDADFGAEKLEKILSQITDEADNVVKAL